MKWPRCLLTRNLGPSKAGCGSAETNNDLWLNQSNLGFKPGTAGRDFAGVGLFVNSSFATGFPFEMFDHIGNVGLLPINAGVGQGLVK